MSHYIPVFFFPIDDHEIPKPLDRWNTVSDLIGERYEKHEEYGMREVSSRNWWFQETLHLLCSGLNIPNLDFILLEVVCLDEHQLQEAKDGLNDLLERIRFDIPDLGSDIEGNNCIWYLRNYYKKGKKKRYTSKEMKKPFVDSEPKLKINNFTDDDYQSKVDFYSFIKSLNSCVEECLSSGKKLLYVQPQP
jgi:hypothetical protein